MGGRQPVENAVVRRIAPIVTIVAVSVVMAATAAAALSPTRLYQALLTKPYPDSQLPSGDTSAKVGLATASKSGLRYHVVGEVTVAVDGPDPDDGVGFDVFPNKSDALGDLNHPTLSGQEKLHIIPGGVPGYPKLPGHMWTGSITGKNALGKTITDGVTLVGVVRNDVLIDAFTDSADNTDSGNIPAALALIRSGLKHLSAVGG
jgi:hypothetical protein